MAVEQGMEHPQCQETQLDDVGVVHVVSLKVIGLSGILLDSQKTKATVSRNKDMLIPPRQMKASLAVVRGNQVYGVSPDSKRLSRVVPSSTTDEHQQQLQQRPVRRYIAVWDNSTIKTTTKSNGEIDASTADSSILFETTLTTSNSTTATATATSTWNVGLVHHENFELIVGLSSPTDKTTIPIGVAALPLNEAAALRGSSGKVVLDLPIRNIAELHSSTNPFVNSSNVETESNVVKAKTKRSIFAALTRRKNVTAVTTASPDVSNTLKQTCIYTLDTSTGSDTATLRVELELHEKESNVEMGLSSSLYSDEPYNILTNWTINDDSAEEASEVVLTESSTDELNKMVVETSTHSTSRSKQYDRVDDNALLEQSIERVLSMRGASTNFRSKFQFSPARRFRVKCNDYDNKFDLTPVPAAVTQDRIPHTPNQEETAVVLECDHDAKTRFLDLTIESILSMKELDDQFETEDDVPLNRNDVPFDEQSFLSRDTVATTRKNKPIAIKKSDIQNEPWNMKPPSLNLSPDAPSSKNLTFGSFWGRGKKCTTADTVSASISITATESSTHSVSNAESDIESPPRIGTIKKVLLPDVGNMLHSSLIDVPPSDHENASSELITTSMIQQKTPVLKPVSILRKKNKPGMEKVGIKSDAQSVVSSSAETEVMKKGKPHVDYEEHFNQIIKELSDAKTPVSDGPDTDATESMQSSSTGTTPPSPNSTYSTPLPSFVAEENEPVVIEEQVMLGKAENIQVKTARKKPTEKPAESLKINVVKVSAHENADPPPHTRSIVSKRNLLAQNLYGFIDIQPCSVKLDQFLEPEDDTLMSVDESWINENSTIDTFKTQRKGTIHDDLADLGLLWGDMCRQTGFRGGSDDDSLLAEEGAGKDKIGTKQRWMAGLRRSSRQNRRGYEYDEIDDNDHSQSSGISGGSFTDENTIRSTTDESESGFSEVGTEVEVNDANGACDNSVDASTTPVLKKTDRIMKSQLLKQFGNHSSRFAQASKGVTDDRALELASDTQSLSSRLTNRWSKSSIDQKLIAKTSIKEIVAPCNTFPSNTSSLPPKAPKYTENKKAYKAVTATVSVRPNTAVDGSHNGGSSNTDSATPQSFQLPKSITQSLVDFVEYVISPSPTPSVTMIPNVPTVLDTDDAASVGDLTATTYERQVEVDEMRRQSKSHHSLSPSTAPFDISLDNGNLENTFEEAQQIGNITSNETTYFSEYDGTEHMSPEIAAAMEAAAAKQMADIIN